tara:strand:- start:651 stop:899 length:249 start_codon:yes stop_codon:yes gene_type:complete
MEKELNKKMKDNNYDIAISNHQDVVMDNEITRSTSGFTGTELPRESSVDYKTFPSLTMGRTHRSVRLDVLIAAPKNLEATYA